MCDITPWIGTQSTDDFDEYLAFLTEYEEGSR